MSSKPERSVDTLNAKPCIVTQRERRTPMAPIFAGAARAARLASDRRASCAGLASSTQTPTSFASPSMKLASTPWSAARAIITRARSRT